MDDVQNRLARDLAAAVASAVAQSADVERCRERAKAAGVGAVVFDRGGYRYHGRIAALAEGAREGGLNF